MLAYIVDSCSLLPLDLSKTAFGGQCVGGAVAERVYVDVVIDVGFVWSPTRPFVINSGVMGSPPSEPLFY